VIRTLIGIALSALAPLLPGTGPDAASANIQSVRLAGPFNDWSPHDDEYLFTTREGRHELLRYWPCGTHEFRFVLDGDKPRALGRSTDDTLVSEGRPIQLRIHTSDEYTIWLDTTKNEWGFTQTAIVNPQPTILIRDPFAEVIRMFVVNCYPPTEEQFVFDDANYFDKYHWQINSLDHAQPDWVLQGKLCRPRMLIKNPGRYDLQFSADYPRGKRLARVMTQLGGGYELVRLQQAPPTSAPASTQTSEQPTQLVPMDDGRWGCTYYFVEQSEHHFFARSVYSDAAATRLAELKCVPKIGQPYLIRFDPADRVLSMQEGNCHEVFFDPRMVELPGGLKPYQIERVELLADFNGWQPGRTRMHSFGEVYRAVLDLPDGITHYQFLVNGSISLLDQRANPRYNTTRPDGSTASGVFIGVHGSSFGPAKPDAINTDAIKHDPARQEFFKPLGGGIVDLTLQTLEGDVQSVQMIGVDGRLIAEMVRAETREGFDYWQARATQSGRRLVYSLKLTDGARSCVLGPLGAAPNEILLARPFLQGGSPTFATPDWAKRAVWHEIDGDLGSMRDRLPQLRDLGVTALCVTTPSICAQALAREATDPATWQWSKSDLDFLDWLKEAHRLGFKVILEASFDHVSKDHGAFQKLATEGESSQFAGWFNITSPQPLHYMAWDRLDGNLPRFKRDDALGLAEPVRNYLFAITRSWMDPNADGDPSDGIDGWRQNHAALITPPFWRDWRILAKSINPDSLLVGEYPDTPDSSIDGRSFDSVVNRRSATGQYRISNTIPPQAQLCMQNTLDAGAASSISAGESNDADIAYQLTFPGAPLISPRAESVPAMLATYRRLIAIRNSFPCLQVGSYSTLLTDEKSGALAYCRSLDDQSVVVILNRSDKEMTLSVPVPWSAGDKLLNINDPKLCHASKPSGTQPAERPTLVVTTGAEPTHVVSKEQRIEVKLPPRAAIVLGKMR
jgi:hypothetical protein